MKLFIKKAGLYCLSLTFIILLIELILRNIPNNYNKKVEVLERSSSDIEVLILGSSYAVYDLNPEFFSLKTFNGGQVGQTLDLDAKIFGKYFPKLQSLKYVIIPLSDISFLYKLSSSSESWRMKNYSIYYGIKANKINDLLEVLSLPFPVNRKRISTYIFENKDEVTVTDLGFGKNYNSKHNQDLNKTIQTTLQAHIINNRKAFQEEKNALEQIVRTCSERNIKTILFIPPLSSIYRSKMDMNQINLTIKTALFLKKSYPNVYFENLMCDSLFKNSDFFDADHLNEIGAKKLSEKMDQYLSLISK